MYERSADSRGPAVTAVGGIPLAPGDHICALHRGREERDRLITPFFADGLREGQTCVFLAPEGEGRAFRDLLATTVPEVRRVCGNLQIKPPEETYLRNGTFDGDRMLDLLYSWSYRTFSEGDAGFACLAADMSWARPLVRPAFTAELIRYETRATRWLRSYPQVGVCLYDLDTFGGDLIIPLIKAHPRVWLNGMVFENPYCLGPDEVAGVLGHGTAHVN
ncbi:MEDS domain-containing protein [Streptomyces sp. NPDC096176]|uniref:MEDS domain-containing protein n=1 Tax=Streptomyces sp. NPDC096176 TaxID=3366079 RepID=UPI0037F59BDF